MYQSLVINRYLKLNSGINGVDSGYDPISKARACLCLLFLLTGCGGDGGETDTAQTITPVKSEYTINTEASAGGSISPQSQVIAAGSNATLTIQPNTGFATEGVTGCSGSLNGTIYVIASINANCTVRVTFKNVQAPPQGLNVTTSANEAKITWRQVEQVQNYKVYIAEQAFATISDLPNDATILQTKELFASVPLNRTYNNYFVRVSANFGTSELLSAEQVQISVNFQATGTLNDTGMSYCLTDQVGIENCQSDFSLRQDARLGRDAGARGNSLKKIGTGSLGFDFTKIDRQGNILANQTTSWTIGGSESGGTIWSCVRDNVTGLVWEIKQANGINAASNKFSWFNSLPEFNNGDPGLPGNSSCGLEHCNTAAYINHLNKTKFCGSSKWRLPNRAELNNILMNSGAAPRLDPLMFPDVQSDTSYWTSSTYQAASSAAWAVSMTTGIVFWHPKRSSLSVRLVHSQ